MRLLVFGRTGQVAGELQRRLPRGVEAVFLDRDEADLSQPALCELAILRATPDAVINAAAYTAVDKAEADEDTALLVNGAAPGRMASACAALGIPFVHLSTDYVFDGKGTDAFSPDDMIAPLGAYGRTKAAGENAIRATGATYVILRTSWVFSSIGSNFVKTMLRLSESRDKLTVVADQVGGPTPASMIADACLAIALQLRTDPGKSGTYHFSGSPDVSWADFAREIFAQSGRPVAVQDILTLDYPTPARRPSNSRLDCSLTERNFGIIRPLWSASLAKVLQELEK